MLSPKVSFLSAKNLQAEPARRAADTGQDAGYSVLMPALDDFSLEPGSFRERQPLASGTRILYYGQPKI